MNSLLEKFISRYGRLPTEFDPDYLEMLRMGRYIVLDMPKHQPGKCANCGSSKVDGRKYVDFGLLVDWYGTVYLCSHCLKDIAATVGLFDDLKAEMQKLVDSASSLEEVKAEGQQLYDKVVQTFKEFEEFYVGIYSHREQPSSDRFTGVGSDETTGEQRTDETESTITEPDSSRELKGFPRLGDILSNP